MNKPFSAAKRFRAFTLIELMLVIGIIGILVTLLLPALKNTRKNARTLVCMSNQRQLAVAQNNYANQYKDLIATFNRPPVTGDDWAAESGRQAQEIVRQVSGKNLTTVLTRYFHRNYWHLPAVADGAFGSQSGSLISDVVACSEDRVVLEWKKNSNNPSALLVGMASDGAPGYEQYRPYWSSFQQVPAAWTADTSANATSRMVSQSTQHHLFWRPTPQSVPFGKRKLADVAFPSSKVWMFDLYDRHFYRRMIWHGYNVARQPLVFFDTSVRVYRTKDARNGHVSPDDLLPSSPLINVDALPDTSPIVSYTYNPSTGWTGYDPPTLSGATSDQVQGKYRWTYKGLRGWDYLGKKAGSGS